MKTITVTNQKGGVGKTTTVLHLATALTDLDQRVLVVDLDPQGHLSLASLVTPKAASAYEVMIGIRSVDSVTAYSPLGFDVVPADQFLARIDDAGRSHAGRDDSLLTWRRALREVAKRYDYCLIDTPPALGKLSVSALLAATGGVLIPVLPEPFALKGLQLLMTTIAELGAVHNPIQVTGVIPSMLRSRWATHQSVVYALGGLLDVPITPSIPNHGAVVRASARRTTVFSNAPRSSASIAYRNLADFVVGMGHPPMLKAS